MHNSTTIENDALAIPQGSLVSAQDLEQALNLFRLPDVSSLALPADPSPQDIAELVVDLDERLANARKIFEEITAPVREMLQTAREQVERAFPEGAKALPHESLDIELTCKEERKRDVAMLRANLPALGVPRAELTEAVFIKTVDVKGCADLEAIDALVKAGAKPVWECDLRALDKLARKYGGGVKDVVEVATARIAVGRPVLTIKRRHEPLKVVGGSAKP